jgi:hypothetical protein
MGRAGMSFICYCDLPVPLKTSWIEENPGRRFWGCTTYNSRVSSSSQFHVCFVVVMTEELPQDNLSEFLLTSYTSTCRQNLHANFSNGWTNQLEQGVWRS